MIQHADGWLNERAVAESIDSEVEKCMCAENVESINGTKIKQQILC